MSFRARIALAALMLVLVCGVTAEAALIGSATLVRDPSGQAGPATVAFGPPEAALGAPWVSYQLSATSDEGDIASWSFRIDTMLHQRWSDGDFDDDPSNGKTLTGPVNGPNGDSHLTPAAGALAGAGIGAPDEDNDYLPPDPDSPLTDTYSPGEFTGGIAWGVGSFLKGDYGLLLVTQGPTANIAKIVIPWDKFLEGFDEPTLPRNDVDRLVQITFRAGNAVGQQIGDTLDECDFFSCIPEPTTAMLAGLALVGLVGFGRRRVR
jgi:hypothetical protein